MKRLSGRKVRSTKAAGKARVGRTSEPRAELEKLKARARELEQKVETLTRELALAGERQTATAEVLQVISNSPGELEPVFQAMLESATRICEAKFAAMYLCEGDAFRFVAQHNGPAAGKGSVFMVRLPGGAAH